MIFLFQKRWVFRCVLGHVENDSSWPTFGFWSWKLKMGPNLNCNEAWPKKDLECLISRHSHLQNAFLPSRKEQLFWNCFRGLKVKKQWKKGNLWRRGRHRKRWQKKNNFIKTCENGFYMYYVAPFFFLNCYYKPLQGSRNFPTIKMGYGSVVFPLQFRCFLHWIACLQRRPTEDFFCIWAAVRCWTTLLSCGFSEGSKVAWPSLVYFPPLFFSFCRFIPHSSSSPLRCSFGFCIQKLMLHAQLPNNAALAISTVCSIYFQAPSQSFLSNAGHAE